MFLSKEYIQGVEKSIIWLAVFAGIGGVALACLGIYLLAKLISYLP